VLAASPELIVLVVGGVFSMYEYMVETLGVWKALTVVVKVS